MEESDRHRKEAERIETAAVGTFKAHPNGVAGMTIMTSEYENNSVLDAEGSLGEEMGGMLVTCGKVEGVVKIWDYTHVGEDSTYGRYGRGSSVSRSICFCRGSNDLQCRERERVIFTT